ncbi:Macrophage mannose receptor 1, partial [Tetrabaena socialis]
PPPPSPEPSPLPPSPPPPSPRPPSPPPPPAYSADGIYGAAPWFTVINTRRWALFSAPLAFDRAEESCRSLGAHLADPASLAEYEAVIAAYAPTTSYLLPLKAVWLGASDADTEGWFYFTADRGTTAMAEVGLSDWEDVWAPAHWSQDGAALDCVAAQLDINTATGTPFAGAWLDTDCATALPYWCVGPASFSAPPPMPPQPPADGNSPSPPLSPPPPFDDTYPTYPQVSVDVGYYTYTLLGSGGSLNWLGAQQQCAALSPAGHLASFADAATLSSVRSALLAALSAGGFPGSPLPYTHSYRPIWVGLYRRSTPYGLDWRWSDRTPLAFSGFGSSYEYGASSALASADCAAMHLDRGGAWSQQLCSRALQYVCSQGAVAAAPPPASPPPPLSAAQLQFRFSPGAGSSVFTLVMAPRSFAAASRFCGALDAGGVLAAPANAQEYVDLMSAVHAYLASNGATAGAAAIAPPPGPSQPPWPPLPGAGSPPMGAAALAADAGESAFWIGIRALSGAYALLDGTTPPPFTTWAAGAYTGMWPVLSCASVDPASQYAYVPAGCGVELPFLCAAPAPNAALSPPPAPAPPPPPPPGSAPTSIRRGLYLYSMYDGALPYAAAASYCTNNGGYLASFHSAAEFAAVWGYFTGAVTALSSGEESVWIGYRQSSNESTWSWVDGGPSVFQNWGLPYTDSEGSDCAAADQLWSGRWVVDDCLEPYPFICKALRGLNAADAPPPALSPPPSPPQLSRRPAPARPSKTEAHWLPLLALAYRCLLRISALSYVCCLASAVQPGNIAGLAFAVGNPGDGCPRDQ